MKKRNGIVFLIVAGTLFAALSCSPRTRYEHRLKKELASGERYDSLFHGLYLGMESRDFYIHCWKLNKEGLIRQGPENKTVAYKVEDELKYPATMEYYPVFRDDRIAEMPVRFVYNGWTPWNKELSSDMLLKDVLEWYRKIYGKGFIKVVDPKHGPAWVKIDGNRRITLFKEDDLHVWAIFTDMSLRDNESELLPEVPETGEEQKNQDGE